MTGEDCPRSCLIMAGGRGSRLGGPWKPLLDVCGEPMILRVARAALSSGACPVLGVAYAHRTGGVASLPWHELGGHVVLLETPGLGYPGDLARALQRLPQPTLVLPADMPLLRGRDVALAARLLCQRPEAVVNLTTRRGLVGVSLHRRPRGSRVWADVPAPEAVERRFLDVDTPEDLEEARRLCSGTP